MTVTFQIKNGDVSISSATGRPHTIGDSDKFSQDIRENIDNSVQEDGTGAGLEDTIGLVGDPFSLRTEISRRITSSFEAYRRLQLAIQKNDRTAKERFGRLKLISVMPAVTTTDNVLDPTAFAFRVEVLSADKVTPTVVTGLITI